MDWKSWCAVLALSLTGQAFECPEGAGCNPCRRHPEGWYRIDCFTSNHSVLRVSIRPDYHLRLTCSDSTNWMEFNLGATSPVKRVKTLDFRRCDLPEGKSLGDIARQLLTDEVEKLYFRSYKNLSYTLTKNSFRGLDQLGELTLSSNGLSELPEDLLEGLENLTVLNLRENDLHRIPEKFFGAPNLEVVELGINKIESFASTAFDKLQRVRLLNIWNNKLVQILPHTFDKLVSLETLGIQRNYLQTLPSDIFARLVSLKLINLSDNNFTKNSLPADLFRNNNDLERVFLFENKRNMTTLPNGFFANLTKLGAVKLHKNGFTSLPEDLFWGSRHLRNVSLEENYLSTLPSKIFYDNYELYILNLSFNELSYLPDDVFSSLGKLTVLDLTKNHLSTVSDKLFSGLLSLRKLNMELWNIESIDTDSFNFIQNLTIADFSHNSLTLRSPSEDSPHVFMEYRNLGSILTKNSLQGFTRIEGLTLSNNNFSELPETLLDDLQDLTYLNLEDNNLHNLPDKFFSATNLETIELGLNKFKSFASAAFDKLQRAKLLNISNNEIVKILPRTFDNLVSLKTLDLRKNKLRTLPSDILARLANLESINLSQNNFDFDSLPGDLFRNNVNLERVALSVNKGETKTLPTGFFANLTKLGAIDLYENDLDSLPENLFRGATGLRNISLQKNCLETLPSKIFNDTNGLSILDLSSNELMHLHDDVFASLRKLVKLDLSHNRLTNISDKLFASLSSLEELNMEKNNIKSVHVNALNALKSLNTVKFSHGSFDMGSFYKPMRRVLPVFTTDLSGTPVTVAYSPYGASVAPHSHATVVPITIDGPFGVWSRMKNLSLGYSGLTHVSEYFLNGFDQLILLNLEGNTLSSLPDKFFSISTLEIVELGMNRIKHFVPTAFDKLNRVHQLNISRNELTNIEPHTFDNLVSLKKLYIHGNSLQALPFNIFARLESLAIINLSSNKFHENSLPADLFSNNGNLQNVDISMNGGNMTKLPNGFFANLTKLETVKLHRNNLTELPEDLFWNTINLKSINLSRNKLDSLPSRIFTDTYVLRTLNLSFNTLSYLPGDVFAPLEKLANLDLSANLLTKISDIGELLRNVQSLERLDMSYNAIANVDIKEFYFSQSMISDEVPPSTEKNSFWGDDGSGPPNIQPLLKVDLRHSNVSRVSLPKIFTVTRHVEMYIENNPIRCDCQIYDLLRYHERTFDSNLETALDLKIDKLKCNEPPDNRDIAVVDFNSETFTCDFEDSEFEEAYCPQMCECHLRPSNDAFLINCAYKGLTEAPRKFKKPAGHCVEMNLTGNSLTTFPKFERPEYDNITKLALDHNRISSLTVDKVPKNLSVLQLNNNNLTRINRETIITLKNSLSLKKLTLEANPWFCDCEAYNFLEFLHWKHDNILDFSKVTCVGNDKSVADIELRKVCPEEFGLIIGSCLLVAFLGIIVGTLAALYYRYQREIKVWLYARQWCLWLVTEDELDRDKLYDAFISFSHKDEDFVVNDLVPKLEEGPRPIKLCLHYRDWLAGEWIPKQIARSVEESRRTIVVLSPNFLESVWGRMEFRVAHSQALTEGRARVIVILYGDIGPTDDLDPELKAYLSMNTYVKWGDPWFWEKLRYALPHPPQLARRKTRPSIFETTQPLMRVENGKSESINASTISPPSLNSVGVFIANAATDNESDKLQVQDFNISNAGQLPNVMDPKNNKSRMNEIMREQCTTV